MTDQKKKYDKPPIVVWWEFFQGRMPRCCFTCAHFDNPRCKTLDQDVPQGYASYENRNCEDYVRYETPAYPYEEDPCF